MKLYKVNFDDGTVGFMPTADIAQRTGLQMIDVERLYANADFVDVPAERVWGIPLSPPCGALNTSSPPLLRKVLKNGIRWEKRVGWVKTTEWKWVWMETPVMKAIETEVQVPYQYWDWE